MRKCGKREDCGKDPLGDEKGKENDKWEREMEKEQM